MGINYDFDYDNIPFDFQNYNESIRGVDRAYQSVAVYRSAIRVTKNGKSTKIATYNNIFIFRVNASTVDNIAFVLID